MARGRTGRLGTTLAILIALGGALLASGALVIVRPFTPQVAQAAPTASRPNTRMGAATIAAAAPSATTPALASAIATATPTTATGAATAPATLSPTAIVPRETAIPAPAAWTVIGRWQADQLIITAPFTTRGPWRICWSLPDARVPFQVMVGNPEQTAWALLSAPDGVTTGAFDRTQGGSFRLMFHSESPYTALVLASPEGQTPGQVPPPPCG